MDVPVSNNMVIQRSDYDRIIKGETRRGWRLAIPMRHLYEVYFPIFSNPTKSISSGEFGDWESISSIVLPFQPWDTIRVNQYSLIQPTSRATLLEIDTDYSPQVLPPVSVCYLSSHVVLVACNHCLNSRMNIFLVNVAARTSRNFTIEVSTDPWFSNFMLAYISSDPKPRLHIVFHEDLDDPDGRLEFIDVKYDCDGFDGPDSLVQPLSSESIVFPVGDRVPVTPFYFGGFPIVAMAYDHTDLADTDKHLCFSFDRHKRWRMETLTQCLAMFRETAEGVQIMNAVKAFSDLKAPTTFDWLQVSALRSSRRLFTVPGRNEVLAMASSDGILRRLVKTPSMKMSAAMSVFRAHPDLKLFEVEKATGVEISDGIRDDGVEEAVRVVEL